MKLSLTSDHKYMEATPVSSKDFSFLKTFPGFVKVRGRYIAPARVNIVKNLVSRIKKHYPEGLQASKSVVDLYKSEFRLLPIPDSFTYFTTPLRHQEIALRYLYTNGGGGLLLDPGLGKTKVVLDFVKLMGFGKSLIVCPKALLFVWQDEVAVHRPDLDIHVRRSMTWDRKIPRLEKKIEELQLRLSQKEDEEDATKLKRSQSLLKRMVKDREIDERRSQEADLVVVNYEKCVQGQIELLDTKIDFLAIDEGLVKDPKSLRTQAITSISKTVSSVVIMSGTLVNNSPVDIFAPVRIMEPALVGGAFLKFRDRFCHTGQVKDENGDVKNTFVVGFKNLPEARNILQAISIVMRKEEWLDLPDKKFFTVECDPSEEQVERMTELAANYITTIGDEYLEVDSPLTAMAKLYQMSNGFVYLSTDEEEVDELFGKESRNRSKRETFYFDRNPKIEAFLDLYNSKLSNRKFILWYNTDAEFHMISKCLEDNRISFSSIRGGEKDTGGKVRAFNSNEKLQVLVCQAKSVNYGITVLGKNPEALDSDIEVVPDIDPRVYTEVFFSLNFSLEVFLQQQDRIHRIGQTHETEYYIIMCNTPVERKIKEALESKTELRETILVDIMNQLHRSILV